MSNAYGEIFKKISEAMKIIQDWSYRGPLFDVGFAVSAKSLVRDGQLYIFFG